MILNTDTNYLKAYVCGFSSVYSEHSLLGSRLKMSDNNSGYFSMDVSWARCLRFTRPCSNKKKISQAEAVYDLFLISEFCVPSRSYGLMKKFRTASLCVKELVLLL